MILTVTRIPNTKGIPQGKQHGETSVNIFLHAIPWGIFSCRSSYNYSAAASMSL